MPTLPATDRLQPLILRGTVFDPPLFCAPMAGITHSAFRRLLGDFGGYGALFTEMLSAKMILHENLRDSPWLKRRPHEGKVIYQLLVTETARLDAILDRLAAIEPAGLDLNAACPAGKVCQQGGGAALFDDTVRLRDVVRVMRRRFAGPLTVKLRLGRQVEGWRAGLRERLLILEAEGVDAVTLHPRFREESRQRALRHQVYAEAADLTHLPVIASGGIMGPGFLTDQPDVVAATAGLMIGRMAAVRPWIFAQWHQPAASVDYVEVWSRLCGYIAEDFPPHKALMRLKILTPYLARNFAFGHTLFAAVQSAPDMAEASARALRFLSSSPQRSRHITLGGI